MSVIACLSGLTKQDEEPEDEPRMKKTRVPTCARPLKHLSSHGMDYYGHIEYQLLQAALLFLGKHTAIAVDTGTTTFGSLSGVVCVQIK